MSAGQGVAGLETVVFTGLPPAHRPTPCLPLTGQRCSGRRQSLRGSSGARPCGHHRPRSFFPDPTDFRPQFSIALLSLGSPRRIGSLRCMGAICGRGGRRDAADRLDPVLVSMLIDEHLQFLRGRSSSAIAKYADAFVRISSAWRNSRFSRSKALRRASSSLAGRTRCWVSRSLRRTHLRKVSGVHPSFGASGRIGAKSAA